MVRNQQLRMDLRPDPQYFRAMTRASPEPSIKATVRFHASDDPLHATSKAGKPYIRLRGYVANGQDRTYGSLMTMQPDSDQGKRLDTVRKGDVVTAFGAMQLSAWTANNGDPLPQFTLFLAGFA